MTIKTDSEQFQEIIKLLKRRSRHYRRRGRLSPFERAAIDSAALLLEVLASQSSPTGSFVRDGFLPRPSKSSSKTPPFPGGGASDHGNILIPQNAPQFQLVSIFSNLMEGLFEQAFTKTKTRTTTSESARSVAAQNRWNLSRSEQDAQLASRVNRGQSIL